MGKRKATQPASPSNSGNIDKFLVRVEDMIEKEIEQMEKKIIDSGCVRKSLIGTTPEITLAPPQTPLEPTVVVLNSAQFTQTLEPETANLSQNSKYCSAKRRRVGVRPSPSLLPIPSDQPCNNLPLADKDIIGAGKDSKDPTGIWEGLLENLSDLLKGLLSPVLLRLEKLEHLLNQVVVQHQMPPNSLTNFKNDPNTIARGKGIIQCQDPCPCSLNPNELGKRVTDPSSANLDKQNGQMLQVRNADLELQSLTHSELGPSQLHVVGAGGSSVPPPTQVRNKVFGRDMGPDTDMHLSSPIVTESNDILHLPPAASPYVVVLTGVPYLRVNQQEDYHSLRNKISHWMIKFKNLPPSRAQNIIMARRVKWIGMQPKTYEGDCVVVNFRDRGVVNFLLRSPLNQSEVSSTIRCLPLCHFYSMESISQVAHMTKVPLVTPRVSIHTPHEASCLPPVALFNRYEALSNLDQQD